MFERFTNESRRVVVLAQEEARKLNHNYIGTEHLLMGLLREGSGAGARALASEDITLEAVEREVEAVIGRGKREPSGHIPFTPRAKKTLELSLREALQLGHSYIGTGHVLLGIIRKGDGVAIEILGTLGANLDHLRAQVASEPEDDPEHKEDPPETRAAPRRPRDDTILYLLEKISHRLGVIERHLCLPSGDESTATLPMEPEQVAQLKAQVVRLRFMLREHDIDPGEPGDAEATEG
jgi:ATP-dependent Clp protease ATP-binding subunit ClpA